MRNNFGDDTLAIRHQHRFARSGSANILAELVLEDFEADGAHTFNVASRGHFVNVVVGSRVRATEVGAVIENQP
jgi:hypothetical protein